MKFNTTTFTDFNKRFFKGISRENGDGLHFYGKKIVCPNVRKNVNAEIILTTQGTSGQYEGYLLKMVHKDNGEVTSEFFAFNDYLVAEKHNPQVDTYGLVIIEHCGTDWYMSSPTLLSLQSMVLQILAYIDDYK